VSLSPFHGRRTQRSARGASWSKREFTQAACTADVQVVEAGIHTSDIKKFSLPNFFYHIGCIKKKMSGDIFYTNKKQITEPVRKLHDESNDTD
jgi:hypothetical protein